MSYDEDTEDTISHEMLENDLFLEKEGNDSKTDYNDHNKVIDELLLDFKDIIKNDAVQNLQLKKQFFYFCCAVLGAVVLTLVGMVITILKYHIPTDLPTIAIEIVSVVASFITAFMVLPKIVAQNLFNEEIQKNIVKIAKDKIKKNDE